MPQHRQCPNEVVRWNAETYHKSLILKCDTSFRFVLALALRCPHFLHFRSKFEAVNPRNKCLFIYGITLCSDSYHFVLG